MVCHNEHPHHCHSNTCPPTQASCIPIQTVCQCKDKLLPLMKSNTKIVNQVRKIKYSTIRSPHHKPRCQVGMVNLSQAVECNPSDTHTNMFSHCYPVAWWPDGQLSATLPTSWAKQSHWTRHLIQLHNTPSQDAHSRLTTTVLTQHKNIVWYSLKKEKEKKKEKKRQLNRSYQNWTHNSLKYKSMGCLEISHINHRWCLSVSVATVTPNECTETFIPHVYICMMTSGPR